jgi:hypothetical protein
LIFETNFLISSIFAPHSPAMMYSEVRDIGLREAGKMEDGKVSRFAG